MAETTSPLDTLLGHAGWLRRLAFALLKDHDAAEDVVQGTLATAWQQPPTREARPWLAEVARNRAEDHRRSERRRRLRETAALASAPRTAPSAEDLIAELDIHRAVAEAVNALAEPFREALVLRFYEGLRAVEIAARLGVPDGTVRWRIKEGISRVRVRLDRASSGDRDRWRRALAPLAGAPGGHEDPAAALTGDTARADRAAASAGASTTDPPRGPSSGPIAKPWPLLALAALTVGGALALGFGREADKETRPSATTDRKASSPRPATLNRPPAPLATPPRFAAGAPEAPPAVPFDVDDLLRQMLAASAAGSYDDFLAHAHDELKATLTKERFASTADLNVQLRGGYRAHRLGRLQRTGHAVYVWRIEFEDGGEDHLALMAIKDETVAGLVIN